VAVVILDKNNNNTTHLVPFTCTIHLKLSFQKLVCNDAKDLVLWRIGKVWEMPSLVCITLISVSFRMISSTYLTGPEVNPRS
jgi:hypothetical protein